MERFALCLVAHTNVGKTTIARTLLGRDVGEVRDAAHVTQEAEGHLLVETPSGDRLELWDTPGFGDSVRLERRLRHSSNPIGWFLTEVWDRYRDRAFWMSQKALRSVVDQADVVLYLADVTEPEEDDGPVEAELRMLRWLGKPVLVLLNQMGQPQGPQADAREIAAWRARTQRAAPGLVQAVLALDAFARCWVQEVVLMRAVAVALPKVRQAAFERIQQAWTARHEALFNASMATLAQRLVEVALDQVTVQPTDWTHRVRSTVDQALRRGDPEPHEPAVQAAHAELARRHAARVRRDTDHLIRLHGLDGQASEVVQRRLAETYAMQMPLDEGRAALVGGVLTSVVTGALTGLKVDVASGGLTLGGGLLAGALAGAAGGAGMARMWNRIRGQEETRIGWGDEALAVALKEALLTYLAVAHYGRGRGRWREAEHPSIWPEAVQAAFDRHRVAWMTWLTQRHAAAASPPNDTATLESLKAGLEPVIRRMSRDLLDALYPGTLPAPRSAEDSGSKAWADDSR